MADPSAEPILDLADFREAARKIAERREAAIASYVEQRKVAAEKKATYKGVRASRHLKMKAAGVGVTEITERIDGEEDVQAAFIEMEIEAGKLKAREHDIESLDAQRSSLHRLADWSQRINGGV